MGYSNVMHASNLERLRYEDTCYLYGEEHRESYIVGVKLL